MASPEDRDALRFLWWPDGDNSKAPQVYREVVDKIVKLEIPVILQNYLNWQTYIGDRMELLKE